MPRGTFIIFDHNGPLPTSLQPDLLDCGNIGANKHVQQTAAQSTPKESFSQPATKQPLQLHKNLPCLAAQSKQSSFQRPQPLPTQTNSRHTYGLPRVKLNGIIGHSHLNGFNSDLESSNCPSLKRKRSDSSSETCLPEAPCKKPHDFSTHIALDCEFVGCGPKGCRSALGRCTIVDYEGNIIRDIFAKPAELITDYRTRYSGLRNSDLKQAIPFESARNEIKRILKGKVVIGHALKNDFDVLQIEHPKDNIRDTSFYLPLRRMARFNPHQPASLKRLTGALKKNVIQRGQHCSIEDARAALELFKLVADQWEDDLIKQMTSSTRDTRKRLRLDSFNESYLNDQFWEDHE